MTYELKTLLCQYRETGGFTVGMLTGRKPESGFAVALPDRERRIPEYLFRCTFDAQIAAYCRHNMHALLSGAMLGCWRDGAEVCLDLVDVWDEEQTARTLGAARGQKAIYDLENQREITL